MAEKEASSISLDVIMDSFKQYVRILKLARKPSMEEFLTIAKVAGAGIILIGIIGFIIYAILITVSPGTAPP
jgi:protein transport protein SEC61 subunit gamma and related proteins